MLIEMKAVVPIVALLKNVYNLTNSIKETSFVRLI